MTSLHSFTGSKVQSTKHALQSAIDEVESHLSVDVIRRLKSEPTHVSEHTDGQMIGLFWHRGSYVVIRARDRASLQHDIHIFRQEHYPR